MISLSTALVDISHLKHHLVWSIEPTMLRLGLHGADIIPLLEGFGCNAAAITRYSSMSSMYQSTMHELGKFWDCLQLPNWGNIIDIQRKPTILVILPYLCMIFIGGIIHNKLWYSHQTHMTTQSVFNDNLYVGPNQSYS